MYYLFLIHIFILQTSSGTIVITSSVPTDSFIVAMVNIDGTLKLLIVCILGNIYIYIYIYYLFFLILSIIEI